MKKMFKYLRNIKILIMVSYLLLPFILLLHSHGSLWPYSIVLFFLAFVLASFLSTNLFLNKLNTEINWFTTIRANIMISYSNRVKLAILGSILLSLFAIDIIWSIIIVDRFYNVFVITFFFYTGGIFSWILALCNPTFTEIDFSMLRRQQPIPATEDSDLEKEIPLPVNKIIIIKKRKVVGYILTLIIAAGPVLIGLMKLIFTDFKKEGAIEIALGVAAAPLVYFTFNKIFNKKEDNCSK